MKVDVPATRRIEDDKNIKEAVKFYAKKLLDSEYLTKAEFHIKPVQESLDYHAHMQWIEWNVFEFTLNTKLPHIAQLQALAHETVHAKQYLDHQLRYSECESKLLWTCSRGKTTEWCIDKLNQMHHNGSYNTTVPWELEAFRGEAALTLDFLRTVVITPDPEDL